MCNFNLLTLSLCPYKSRMGEPLFNLYSEYEKCCPCGITLQISIKIIWAPLFQSYFASRMIFEVFSPAL